MDNLLQGNSLICFSQRWNWTGSRALSVADGCWVPCLEAGSVQSGVHPHEVACWQREERDDLSLCEHF